MSKPGLVGPERPATHTSVAAVAIKLSRLNADELEAIDLLLEKLLAGKAKYGPLDLDTDQRDWLAEIVGEQLDTAFYVIFALIQRRRGLL